MSPSDYFYRSSIPHQAQVCTPKVSQLITCVQDSTDKTIQLQDNETYTCNVRSTITYSTGLSVTRHHPAGNVVEFLISTGLACVVDWHAGSIAYVYMPTPPFPPRLQESLMAPRVGDTPRLSTPPLSDYGVATKFLLSRKIMAKSIACSLGRPGRQSNSSLSAYVHVYRIDCLTRLSDPRQAYFTHLSLSPWICIGNSHKWMTWSRRLVERSLSVSTYKNTPIL